MAFTIIFLEVITLVSSNVWEDSAPTWTREIIDNRAEMLSVSAAITILMSLILAIGPGGLAKYAAVGGGTISFAAAANSIEIESLHTALIVFALIAPIYLVSFPILRFSKDIANLTNILGLLAFFSLLLLTAIMSVSISLERVIVPISGHSKGDLVTGLIFWSVAISALIVACLIIFNLFVQLMGDWNDEYGWLPKIRQAFRTLFEKVWWKGSSNRAARRRRDRSSRQ